MGKKTALLTVVLLSLFPGVDSQATTSDEAGKPPADPQRLQDRLQENACDCCRKCKAARSAIKPKQEEGAGVKDACKVCCDRCGTVLKPTPEEIPPEVIDRKKAPDNNEKREQ